MSKCKKQSYTNGIMMKNTAKTKGVYDEKIISLFLAIFLLAPMSFATSAAEPDEQRVRLSELPEEECIEFIVSEGLEIPSKLLDYSSLGGFIKYVITAVEANPNKKFIINDGILFAFANRSG